MDRASHEDRVGSFERAALLRGSDEPAPSDLDGRRARRILAARRETEEGERCPTDVVHRVQGWFAARPRGLPSRNLELVRGPALAPAFAVRGPAGSSRVSRYAGGGATVDLRVQSTPRHRVVDLAVTPMVPGFAVEVHTCASGPSRRVRLDAAGTGRVRLPARATRLRAIFRIGTTESFRIDATLDA